MIAGGAAGGTIGASVSPAGAVIGAGAGTFALPEMLDTALEEYMKFKEEGGKLSFEKFVEVSAKIADKGMYHGALGSMMPMLNKILPEIKAASPAAKAFFETSSAPKIKEMLTKTAITTAGLVGAESIAKREKPTLENVAFTFGQVFGFNLFEALPGMRNKITKKVNEIGADPIETAQKVKFKFEDLGGTEEGLKSKNPKDVKLLNRAINDITKEKTPEAAKVSKVETETPKAEVGKEQLAEKEAQRKEYAEKIAKEPVEEYVTKPKMTKKEKNLFIQQKSLMNEIAGLNDEISRYQKAIDDINASKKMTKQKEQTKGQLKNLLEQRKEQLEKSQERLGNTQKDIKKAAPKPSKKQTPEEKQYYLDEHMRQLKEMSRNPEGVTAQEWNKMFENDQKYQKMNEKNMKRGKLPPPEYVTENLKILDRYYEEYQALDKLAKEKLKTAKGKAKEALMRLRKNIETNSRINRNKKAVWERYRTVKEAVKKPFIAKMLQDMGKNMGRHERVIFEAQKALGQSDVKAKEAWNKFKENPTSENLKEAANESGMDGEKIQDAFEKMEESIKEEDTEKSEEKEKEAEKIIDEELKDKTPKEKKDFWYSPSGIFQAILKKLGFDVDRRLIRLAAYTLDIGGFVTAVGAIKKIKNGIKILRLSKMIKSKDYKGIEKMQRKHLNKGKSKAAWNKLMNQANKFKRHLG